MGDLISRQEALKPYMKLNDSDVVSVYLIKKNLMEQDSVDARENIHGAWLLVHPLQDDDEGAYMCSVCRTGNYNVNPDTWKCCPYCMAVMDGTNMRGKDE